MGDNFLALGESMHACRACKVLGAVLPAAGGSFSLLGVGTVGALEAWAE